MISIALTTYNGEKYIQEQIDSIMSQTITDFELIITDDLSSDRTFEILTSYAKKDNRVKPYRNEHNLGYPKNFEKAISLCSGEYIALSDQDDVWTKDHLEKLYNAITSEKNLTLSCANSTITDKDLRPIQLLKPRTYKVSEEQKKQFFQAMHGNFAQGCCLMFDARLNEQLLPFPKEEKFHDYWILFVAVANGKVKYIPDSIEFYRQHENNFDGAVKRTFIKKIKNALNGKVEIGQKMVTWLKPVEKIPEVQMNQEKKSIYNQAVKYWTVLKENKSRRSTLKYFWDNYKMMFFKDNNKGRFFRTVKMIFKM